MTHATHHCAVIELPATTLAQVTQLSTLDMADLKALWHQLFSSHPPTHVRSLLEKQLAYKLQEQALEQAAPDVAAQHQQRINQLVNEDTSQQPNTLQPGTVLTRHYQGQCYEVLVIADGEFQFNRKPYRSLSKIAREITGTRWSGPAFFGLRSSTSAKGKNR